ncbi:small multi-drug export protein [Ascidiimonas aurantiaca]|uniref:COG2426 family protein n=1 Tax=Ascidiimonas aurantiaca TaxID=1685432 RepID=UPI0030EEB2D9
MIRDILFMVLWTISPLGEGKVGIPYGLLSGLDIYLVFILCFLANLLVFPMMLFFLDKVNRYLLRWYYYKKAAIYVARRAKTGSGGKIQKYGFLGLMIFVMIPLPGTGVYAGSIAAWLFKIEKHKAFTANAIGIFLSSILVWGTTLLTMKGVG